MEDLRTILGLIAFLLLALWRIYWRFSEQKAEREKPKATEHVPLFDKKRLPQYFNFVAFGVVGAQLLGVRILEMPEKSIIWQWIGFVLVVIGLATAVKGREDLGTNWANCFEYQVKKKQSLVTNGIYGLIRHPIYIGIVLFFIGSELIVQSYLFYIYVCSFVAANQQACWEEKLLLKHFGETYRMYMNRTKRLIPYLW